MISLLPKILKKDKAYQKAKADIIKNEGLLLTESMCIPPSSKADYYGPYLDGHSNRKP